MKIYQILCLGIMIMGMVSCGPDEVEGGGDIQIAISAEFNEAPFFINKEYIFPNGRKVRFSKLDFYVSDFVLKTIGDDNNITSDLVEVGFINLSSSEINQLDPLESQLSALNIPVGDYSNLSFTLGLSDQWNSKTPSDSDLGTNNPLTQSSHYWVDWGSYIFMRLEGAADFNDNGTIDSDETFNYHTGKSGYEKRVSLNTPVSIVKDDLTSLDIALDVNTIFFNSDGSARFDMSENRSIHNSSGLETIDDVMTGAANSMKMK